MIRMFVGLVLTMPVLAQAQDLPLVDRPEAKVGDARAYNVREPSSATVQKVEDLAVTEVGDAQILMKERSSGVEIVYDREWALKRVGSRSYSPAIKALVFPMKIGQKWEHSNTYTHPSCGLTTSDLSNEVVGWEDVTVPAGTFRALRVDSAGYWRNSCGRDRLAYKFWYVPKVKWLVKSESLTYSSGRIYEAVLRELKSFQVD